MTLVQRMDEFINKLESNDEEFIKNLNTEFKQYCEKNSKIKSCQGKDVKTACMLNGYVYPARLRVICDHVMYPPKWMHREPV